MARGLTILRPTRQDIIVTGDFEGSCAGERGALINDVRWGLGNERPPDYSVRRRAAYTIGLRALSEQRNSAVQRGAMCVGR